MTDTWIYLEVKAEGYFKVALKDGQTPQQAAVDIMENGDFEAAANSSYWMGRLLNGGIVSVGACPAAEETAQRFHATLDRLKEPFNPDDFVEVERPS